MLLFLLQTDGRPLLQKEYPKVQRPSSSEENQVIERIKASLRRLSCNTVSSLGMCILVVVTINRYFCFYHMIAVFFLMFKITDQ